MLKMYHQRAPHAGSPDFWESLWNEGNFEESLRFCQIDPLRPLFERYAPPGTSMLEGGCGHGQYVAYYTSREVKVVGLDFARHTLAQLHTRHPLLMLCTGDVAALPFRDASFDVYYSGGVVEHFEGGAEAALREAWRVLRPGKTLLISVPYFSPLRRLLSLVKLGDNKRVSGSAIDEPSRGDDRQFFQYAYTRNEFKSLLSRAGFRVISTQGYAILWGLQELPFAERAMTMLQRRRDSTDLDPSQDRAMELPTSRASGEPPSLLKRLIVSEDVSVPVAGLGIRALRLLSANMMMYVCTRENNADT